MNIDIFKNKIIIMNDSSKKYFLNIINESNNLINFKIITLSELKKKYLFDYDDRAIYFVMQKYNVIYDIAKIYLENLYFVNEDISSKTKLLLEIKKDLKDNNLLIENIPFRKFLKNKDIVLFDLDFVDNFYKNVFKELGKDNKITSYSFKNTKTVKDIYSLDNPDEEIAFVASEICKLVKLRININNIKLANVSDNYLYKINNIFKLFNIPFEVPKHETIAGTIIVKKFKELFCDDINLVFESLKEFVKTSKDEKIYKKIINVVNDFYWCSKISDCKEIIFNKIDMIKKDEDIFSNAVRTIDFDGYIPNKDDYVFLINFNEGVFPKYFKDEDYLSDKEKIKLNISSSYEKNDCLKSMLINKIGLVNNLIISYSKNDLSGEIYISSLYDKNIMNIKEGIVSFNESDNYNLIKLLKENDLYHKYKEINSSFTLLNNHYKNNPYMTYRNDYKKIDKDKLYNHLNNKLSLSYSSMNNYYNCAFRYYLSNVLYLNKFEDTFEITIGNIFHEVLSECFCEDYDFDKRYDEIVGNCKYNFSISERYFINKLKKELEFVIETIKEQLRNTNLKKTLYEQEIIIDVNKDLNVTFKGYVDKVLYDEFDGDVIAVVVDYKTGTPKLSLDNAYYGLSLQLPVYVYLLKNSNLINNVKIGGFYLQKIINNSKTINDKKKDLKLSGYSNSDLNILENVDTSFENSNFIKSLSYSNNKFGYYSKVLSNNEIDRLSELVNNKVEEASKNILDANFQVNPKQIDDKLEGCEFCKFKDICFRKNEDIVVLDPISKDDFLGGDINA